MTLEQAVQKFRVADRAYQADCNLRWQIKTDAKRRKLRAASRRAFDHMTRVITNLSARRG